MEKCTLTDWYKPKRGSLAVPLRTPLIDLTNPVVIAQYQATVKQRQEAIKKCEKLYHA